MLKKKSILYQCLFVVATPNNSHSKHFDLDLRRTNHNRGKMKKMKTRRRMHAVLFQLGWLLPTLHGSFLPPEFNDRMSDHDEPMSQNFCRKLDHSKKEGGGKPCFSDAELACRLALQGRKQLFLGANAAVTRCLRRVFLRSSSIKLGFRDSQRLNFTVPSCTSCTCTQWLTLT